MRTPSKTLKTTLVPEGVGAGWSEALRVSGLGRSGEVVTLAVRGDLGDATAGTMTLVLFEAPLNSAGTLPDPAAIADENIALRIAGLTVAASATVASDSVNVRDLTKWAALYAVTRADQGLFLAIQGVTGKVHVTLRAQGA